MCHDTLGREEEKDQELHRFDDHDHIVKGYGIRGE